MFRSVKCSIGMLEVLFLKSNKIGTWIIHDLKLIHLQKILLKEKLTIHSITNFDIFK